MPDPSDWWFQAFPVVPYGPKPPGENKMLTLIAYDISSPRRLARVASVCEDFGTRVQYSLFESRLEPAEIELLWKSLLAEIDPAEDRIVAYQIDARSAREIRTAGRMVCSEKVVCYLI